MDQVKRLMGMGKTQIKFKSLSTFRYDIIECEIDDTDIDNKKLHMVIKSRGSEHDAYSLDIPISENWEVI